MDDVNFISLNYVCEYMTVVPVTSFPWASMSCQDFLPPNQTLMKQITALELLITSAFKYFRLKID